VYTVAGGKATEVAVTTGAASGSLVAIDGDGLRAGMPVIVRGNERVVDGSRVKTAAEDGP
jgi:multidrug efflux pump subunit AcrA (membrane-fusion protein)